ncbi:MAG TPA: response regulator transcription factor [Verrucomicrobiae bacterium]|nr:response regulator transcription factor [Verrucomicrobiae bacterium]
MLVDDHPMIREHIARILNKEPDMEVIGEADNVQEALAIIQTSKPHLAIVDMTLCDESGLDLVKILKVLSIPVPVLVLTMHDDSIRAERAFRAGVQGFITKHQSTKEIIAAVRLVLAGKMYLSEDMVGMVLKKLTPGQPKDVKYHSVDRLSNQELKILEAIGNGQSSRAIARAFTITDGTLSTYRRRIKKKLDLKNHNDLRHFAIKWLSERD